MRIPHFKPHGTFFAGGLSVMMVFGTLACDDNHPENQNVPATTIQSPLTSVTALELGPDNQLFIADSYGGRIYSVNLESGATQPAQHFNIKDVDSLIANYLGVPVSSLVFTDLVVRSTYQALVGLNYTQNDQQYGLIASISLNEEVELLDLTAAESIEIPAPHTEEILFFGSDARVLSVTDMDYFDGKLYVAGLSNGDFASVLYTFPVPLDGTAVTTSVEIYHAIHDQIETRAPIRTQTVVNLDGVPHLVAAYTCTPVVTIPVADLIDGAHIVGKTIAEVGYGNTPVDIIDFEAQGQDGVTRSFVLLSNRERGTMLFQTPTLTAAAQADGLSEPVNIATAVTAGAPFVQIPMGGVLFMAEQDAERLVAFRRDPTTGRMELVSFLKNIYFRLSDHWSEYNFPSYEYTAEQDAMWGGLQRNMKQSEGYDPDAPGG